MSEKNLARTEIENGVKRLHKEGMTVKDICYNMRYQIALYKCKAFQPPDDKDTCYKMFRETMESILIA